MREVKYPVIVRVNGQQSFEWLTLVQANERFVVVNNRLVVNNVEPLSLEYCQFLLEQAQKSLEDYRGDFALLCEDVITVKDNSRFVSEYLQPKINDCKQKIKQFERDIAFLKKSISFLNS